MCAMGSVTSHCEAQVIVKPIVVSEVNCERGGAARWRMGFNENCEQLSSYPPTRCASFPPRIQDFFATCVLGASHNDLRHFSGPIGPFDLFTAFQTLFRRGLPADLGNVVRGEPLRLSRQTA